MMPSAINTSVTTSIRGDGNPFKLRSPGGIIEPRFLGRLQPTSTDTPMEEIRRQYEQDGYVWLKRLLPPFDVWNTRKDYFEFLASTGLIKEGTNPKDGIYCGRDWGLVSENSLLLINDRSLNKSSGCRLANCAEGLV